MISAQDTLLSGSVTQTCTQVLDCNKPSDNTTGIVLSRAANAKEKAAKTRFEHIVSAVLMLAPKKPALIAALIDRACSEDTSRTIAQRYSVCESTLSFWGRRIGLRAQPRGRRALNEPTSEHMRILELVRVHGGAEAARRIGISKQWVSRVVHKWSPQLAKRPAAKIGTKRPTLRRLRRNFVVSFRMTKVEWDQLQTAQLPGAGLELSRPNKARAIVLNHIAPLGGDGSTLPKSSMSLALGNTITEIVNVSTQSVTPTPHGEAYQL